MATMGKYCKAYPLDRLRKFSGWSEKAENARKEMEEEDEEPIERPRNLTDESIVYLQENYVVTDGILMDENILFEDVTPEWIEYCHAMLEFEIPEYARSQAETLPFGQAQETA
jgi:hypothetical protein